MSHLHLQIKQSKTDKYNSVANIDGVVNIYASGMINVSKVLAHFGVYMSSDLIRKRLKESSGDYNKLSGIRILRIGKKPSTYRAFCNKEQFPFELIYTRRDHREEESRGIHENYYIHSLTKQQMMETSHTTYKVYLNNN